MGFSYKNGCKQWSKRVYDAWTMSLIGVIGLSTVLGKIMILVDLDDLLLTNEKSRQFPL